MALVQSIASYSGSGLQGLLADAFEYAGGRFTELTTVLSTMIGTSIGDCTYIQDGNGVNLAWFGFGGGNFRCGTGAYADATHYVGDTLMYPNSSKTVVVATRRAISITYQNTSGVSVYGTIIALDNNDEWCCVTIGGATGNLNNPRIVPRTTSYYSDVKYLAESSTSFGCLSACRIPVPSFAGEHRHLPTVAFAVATMESADKAILVNGEKWYMIGGVWLLKDED